MKILITGASGFIGKKIVDKLINKDFEIYVLLRKNIKEFQTLYPNVNIVEGDLKSIKKEKLIELKITTIIHLAWENVSKVLEESHYDHLQTQIEFFNKLSETYVNKILVSGTCFEYGKIEGKLNVTVEPQPISQYGIAKDKLRKWLIDFCANNKSISISWMRLFYVFGEGQHERSLYSQLLSAINEKNSEFKMSKGLQIRDFINVNTVADDFLKEIFINRNSLNIMNICSENPISVRDFVENIIKNHNANIKLNLGVYEIPTYEPLAFWGSKEIVINYQ